MNVLSFVKRCGRLLAGTIPRKRTLAAWIAGASLAAGLTAMPVGSGLTQTAHAQPQPPAPPTNWVDQTWFGNLLAHVRRVRPAPAINWVDQTWAIAPAGPGQWALMLSMTYDKDGSVVLPVGVIAGVEKDVLTTINPPPTEYLGFSNTSIVQCRLEGTLFISAGLIAALGLDPSYEGDMFSVRWDYTHPTEGAAYVQVGSSLHSKWEPVLAKIRTHYEATINPALLPEWDTATTYLVDKHDQPGRVKRPPAGGGRWRWIPGVVKYLWDIITPTATPVPTPPPPAQAPGNPTLVAACRQNIARSADHFAGRCAARHTCPPAAREACVTCVHLERDQNFINCDLMQHTTVLRFLACTTVACD